MELGQLANSDARHRSLGQRFSIVEARDGGVGSLQVFPATLINNAVFQFNHGLYQAGSLQVFVSQGAGTFLQRIRLGSDNEVNMLRLTPQKPA